MQATVQSVPEGGKKCLYFATNAECSHFSANQQQKSLFPRQAQDIPEATKVHNFAVAKISNFVYYKSAVLNT